MNKFEKEYSELLHKVCRHGEKLNSRNGKTRQLTNLTISADLSKGLPIVTGKKIFPKSCFIETEWMLRGLTNVNWLNEKGVKIWNEWADDNGDLGPVYGKQLRNFNGIDQLKELVNSLKKDYYSRRHIVSYWNPSDLKNMKLPPCHYAFQLVTYKDKIDCVVSMRSLDMFIGLPYDILMYSIILTSLSKEVNKQPGVVYINAAAAHVYEDHVREASIYAGRKKMELVQLLDCPKFSDFDYNKIKISEYFSDSRLKVNVKV